MTRQHRRTLLVFGALASYIMLQSIWWAYLLVRKDRELEGLIEAFQLRPQYPGTTEGHAYRTLLMVLSEGGVFLGLLLIALILTYRTIRKDLALAATQRDFLLAVTHELRTPIASAKLQLQTLGRSGPTAEQRKELITQAVDDLDRLGLLTDKVLTALRAADGKIPLRPRSTDVEELVRDRVERIFSGSVRSMGTLDHEVHVDPIALASILDNLIENAIKYGPSTGTVDVELEGDDRRWEVRVMDRGPGVDKDDRERIFSLFQRGGQEETRDSAGTGLGLFIARGLARRMGGDLHYRERPGGGAIFAATFPRA
ncbi:MAG: HAMP domain-containing histidine kinase [Flavobacteriales bacterium]|nr:HAMP domain-containing histidine kinase [Flavobacteriales bacterium]MCB9167359.1 HAMP domain-containing histidine kinase [Flavobacteriales bacterium]